MLLRIVGLLILILVHCSNFGYGQVNVIRGPYLQMLTQESIIVRWDTDLPSSSKVSYGFDSFNQFALRFDTTSTTKHSIELTGLLPNTHYSYSIQTMDSVLLNYGNLFFKTLPEVGQEGQFSFMVLGDAGQGSVNQAEVSLAFQNVYGQHHDGVILLGDNAYYSGTQAEYQNKFFTGYYNTILENTVIWPAPGNHDYYSASIPMTPTAPYFDIFDLPQNGECGGVPSGTEQYYSFNYGNVHFISLDSYAMNRSDTATMATWLKADLIANELPWIIAYWHHPPYSKGSHDSDNSSGNDYELVEMRENIIPILDEYNVDLVLNGHSHSYERSKLIWNHYGPSSSFTSANVRSRHSGNDLDDCAYYKFTDSLSFPKQGTVYSVVGVSGKLSGKQPGWPHPIMYSYSNEEYGALRILIEGSKLTAEFLTSDEIIFDRFVIKKDVFESASEACTDPHEDDWFLSPNPGINEIVLHRYGYKDKPSDEFFVYDLNGNILLQQGLKEENKIDLTHLGSGMYVIVMKEGEIVRRMKFIKI